MSSKKAYVKPDFKYWPASELDAIKAKMSGGGGTVIPPDKGWIHIVNNPAFVLGQLGHSAILFEYQDSRCRLYSFNPYDNATPDAQGLVMDVERAADRASFSNFKSACLSGSGVLLDNPNVVVNEPFRRCLTLRVPYQNFLNMQNLADSRRANPPMYNLLNYNCQCFVNEVLAAGYITLRTDAGASLANTIIPNVVIEQAASAVGADVFGKSNF